MKGRTNTGGGGVGDGSAFVVVGGTTRPEKAAENTVWINTDVEITDYVLSATEPVNPVAGMAWLEIADSGDIALFAPVDGNYINLCLDAASQYVDGEWVEKEVAIYQRGAWVELSYSIKIVSDGILKMPILTKSAKYESGSASAGNDVSVTQQDGYVLVAGSKAGYGMAYIEIVFNDESEIILEGNFAVESSNARYYRLAIWSEIGSVISSNMVAYQNFTATGARLPIPEGVERGKSYFVGITTVYTYRQQITRFEIV